MKIPLVFAAILAASSSDAKSEFARKLLKAPGGRSLSEECLAESEALIEKNSTAFDEVVALMENEATETVDIFSVCEQSGNTVVCDFDYDDLESVNAYESLCVEGEWVS